jgi:transposase
MSFLCLEEFPLNGGEVNSINKPSITNLQTPDSSRYQIFVGIDIGYRTHVACAIPGNLFNAKRYPDGWKRAKTSHFSSDAAGFKKLQKYLASFSSNPAHFLILSEPSGGHYGLALLIYLKMKHYSLLQVENKAVKEYREDIYGSETKTDDTDARLMARMGFLHEWVGEEFSIQQVRIASPDESMIRLMSRDLMRLTKEMSIRKCQLHQMFAYTFPELKTVFTNDITCASARKLIKKYPTPQELSKASVEEIAEVFINGHDRIHEKQAGELLALAQNSVGVKLMSHHIWRQGWMLEQMDVLETARNDLLAQLEQLIVSHPYTPIIESLPAKSPIWTAALIGMIGNIDRFHNYAEFRAYAGWYPKISQSGTSLHSSSLTNEGARSLRNVFAQMSRVHSYPNYQKTAFSHYYQRLKKRGMRPSAALGHVSGKLASVLYCCLKTMTPYDEKKHLREMGFTNKTEATSEPTIEATPSFPDTDDGQNVIAEPIAI